MGPDETDTRIIETLRADGRTSNREIARRLGVSEGAVRQRIKKMEANRIIQFGLVMDRNSVGFNEGAYVRIRAHPSHVRAIARKIAEARITQFVGITLGDHDIVAFLIAASRSDLVRFLDHDIMDLAGVISIDVKEPVGSAKHRFDLIYIAE